MKGTINLKYLHATKDFVHHFYALVLILHLFKLKLLGGVGQHAVNRDQKDHHTQSSKHGRTYVKLWLFEKTAFFFIFKIKLCIIVIPRMSYKK